MDKGYYRALEEAGGDASKVKRSYGWYCVDEPFHEQYDKNGDVIAFT